MKTLMQPDEIDLLLSRKDEILPSSGFASSVMDAVRREAAVPPPIPFPWRRALPGLVIGAVALSLTLTGVLVLLAQSGGAATAQISTFSMTLPSALTPFQRNLELATVWTVVALLAAFVSVKLSMRLSSGRA